MIASRFEYWRRRLPLVVFALASVGFGPLVVLVSSAPQADAPVLVISGWGDAGEGRIAQAGGRSLGPVRAAFGHLAVSENPDFPARLRREGAWAIVGGARIAKLCGATP